MENQFGYIGMPSTHRIQFRQSIPIQMSLPLKNALHQVPYSIQIEWLKWNQFCVL